MLLLKHWLKVLVLAMLIVVASATASGAHADFVGSDPEDGALLGEPVEVATLSFTNAVEPVDDGFQVLDGDGMLRVPVAAGGPDGTTWELRFDPPLEGSVGVRWMVKAPDAHPISGSFIFDAGVAVQAPTVVDESGIPEAPRAAPLQNSTSVEPSQNLEEFLVERATPLSVRLAGGVGRVLSLAASLVSIGALLFAAVVLRGERRDFTVVMFWIRRSAVALVVGSVLVMLEFLAVDTGGGLSSALDLSAWGAISSYSGLALFLRVAGGVLLVAAARVPFGDPEGFADPVVKLRELVGVAVERAGLGDAEPVDPRPYRADGDIGWVPRFSPAHPVLGALLIVLSFTFDGHTVGEGTWLALATLDIVHVAAASTWTGGVLMIGVVLWHRHREQRPSRATQLALRFSVVAGAALTLTGAAGVAMAAVILDSPGELFSTSWGRLLIAKTVFVAVAAAVGGYNHVVMIPAMSAEPETGFLDDRFAKVLKLETTALALAASATALLVVAAS
jgi:copper transport protein